MRVHVRPKLQEQNKQIRYVPPSRPPFIDSTSGLNMKVRSALFWMATILAGLIALWVVSDYLYDLSEGFFPVLNVHALVIAAVIWLLGLIFRRTF